VQVCARLDDSNVAREVRGAVHGARLPGKRRALVLTLDQDDRLVEEGVEIEVRRAWQWLLDDSQHR
jgi:hypothetical protein